MAAETTTPKTLTIADIMRMRGGLRQESAAVVAERERAAEMVIASRKAQNARF